MAKTVRLPEDVHEELKARSLDDETMAETIARYIHRPHPEETREMFTAEDAAAVSDAVDDAYAGGSDRLDRVREAFEDDEAGNAT